MKVVKNENAVNPGYDIMPVVKIIDETENPIAINLIQDRLFRAYESIEKFNFIGGPKQKEELKKECLRLMSLCDAKMDMAVGLTDFINFVMKNKSSGKVLY